MNTNIHELEVIITEKCNKDCGFCKGADYMAELSKLTTLKAIEVLEKVINDNPNLTTITWSGGEPLLNATKLRAMLGAARTLAPNVKHQLLTNGLKINGKNATLLREFDEVVWSLDGYDRRMDTERSLMDFYERRSGRDALSTIRDLPNVRTWAVVTRKQLKNYRWHENIIEAHNALTYSGITTYGIIIEKTETPEELTTDQTLNFIVGYNAIVKNLARLNKENGTDCTVEAVGFFVGGNCSSCSKMARLKHTGELSVDVDAQTEVEFGCASAAENIGFEAYKYINRVLNPKRVEFDESTIKQTCTCSKDGCHVPDCD